MKTNSNWRCTGHAIFRILRQLFDLVGAITSKVFHVSCSNLLSMLLIRKFDNGDFLHCKSIIGPCEIISCILPKFFMHVTNDKFDNG